MWPFKSYDSNTVLDSEDKTPLQLVTIMFNDGSGKTVKGYDTEIELLGDNYGSIFRVSGEKTEFVCPFHLVKYFEITDIDELKDD